MNHYIIEGGHFAFDNLFSHFASLPSLGSPFREIESSASIDHIMADEPGEWNDAAVPGPDRLVAVAVKAGALGQLPGLGAVPGWLLEDRRVLRRAAQEGDDRYGCND